MNISDRMGYLTEWDMLPMCFVCDDTKTRNHDVAKWLMQMQSSLF